MKPLATLNRPVLETVDVVTKESTVSFRERTDVTAVPAMGVVAETMTALVLASEALRKFGGDSLAEVVRNRDGYLAALGRHPRRRSAAVGPDLGTTGSRPTASTGRCDAPHPAGRDDGRRQDDGRASCWPTALGWRYLDSDAEVEAGHRPDRARAVRPRRRGGLPRKPRRPCWRGPAPATGPSVVSVAGGAVLGAENRALLAASGTVVWLRARPETLAARVGDGAGRPLLGRRPGRRPGPARAPAGAPLRRGGRPRHRRRRPRARPGGRAPSIAAVGGRHGDRRRLIDHGRPGRPLLPGAHRRRAPATSWPACCPRRPSGPWSSPRRPRRRPAGSRASTPACPSRSVVIPDGEAAKTLATVETLARRFAAAGLSRADVVVAVGGGIVTDVAGFAAATYHRGTAYVNVATTLLAQVDAAIGGKTGVNLPEGKNLVGAFWQPTAVLCDTETLTSLPPREWACGKGEMAKYAFLGEPARPPTRPIDEQVARCVAIKADGGGGRRARGRPAHDPQLRPHPGPRPRRAPRSTEPPGLGPAPRRGGGHRAHLRRPAGPAPGAHRRGPGGRAPRRGRRLRPADRPARRGPRPPSSSTFMGRDKKAQQDLTFVLDGPDGRRSRSVAWPSRDVLATLADMGAPHR